ncbi:MAG: cupin domain-containing protein [Gammaproteobacteria bacterium]
MSKTIQVTREQIEARVARFEDLKPLKDQSDYGFPQEALDIAYARQLKPVIGAASGEDTALTDSAPILGAGGMTMTYVFCPPGQGPGLHSHQSTFETFIVLEGRFEFSWGDHGEESLELGKYDVVSFEPGFCRAFRNVGDVDGLMQVIITGGVHDMNDIDFRPEVGEAIAEHSPELRDHLEKTGMRFTAGMDN